MIRLEGWSMIYDPNPYLPPEVKVGRLVGAAYGHPSFEDGDRIVSSPIVEINVRKGFAKTRSGSEYILGRPNPDWVEWLKENEFTDTLADLDESEGRLMN